MTDPWADVREEIESAELDSSDAEDWAAAYSMDCTRLLADADALLTMKEYADHKHSCELPEQGVRGICNCGFTQVIAALPEHLRGDSNERSRKA